MRLAAKVAIVTGAGSGFGRGIAEAFAEEGAKLVIADIDERRAAEVAKEIGSRAVAATANACSTGCGYRSSTLPGSVHVQLLQIRVYGLQIGGKPQTQIVL